MEDSKASNQYMEGRWMQWFKRKQFGKLYVRKGMLQTDLIEKVLGTFLSIQENFLKLERAELLQGIWQAEDCKTDTGPGDKASPTLWTT